MSDIVIPKECNQIIEDGFACTKFIFNNIYGFCGSIRQDIGFMCGYINLPQEHSFFGKDYESINDLIAEEHSLGFYLTYAAEQNGNWVVGFDTGMRRRQVVSIESVLQDLCKLGKILAQK